MRRAARRALCLAALAVGVVACEREEIVLLTLPTATPGDGDAAPDAPEPPPGPPCAGDEGCAPGTFCSFPSCDAPAGRCERRPTFCDGAPSPVCGCDGITYWNECWRRTRGQRAATAGECPLDRALACRGGRECREGGSCARILPPKPGPCGEGPGVCWSIPPVCPPSGIDRFQRCEGPGGPAGACVDLCTAIRSSEPHVRAVTCP